MGEQTPWYRDEGGIFSLKYFRDHAQNITAENTLKEVEFIEETLSLQKGQKILDLCCGHGRHSVQLALRGYRVTGQDISQLFLQKAKEEAEANGVKVEFIEGDMRVTTFENEFDAVINMFTSFGYLESDDENQKVLVQVHKALRTGGKFLIDLVNRDNVLRHFVPRGWQENEDGSYYLVQRDFDIVTSRDIDRRIRIEPDGTTETVESIVRMHTLTELVGMLKAAELEFLEAYGDFDGSSYSMDSRRMIVIARK